MGGSFKLGDFKKGMARMPSRAMIPPGTGLSGHNKTARAGRQNLANFSSGLMWI
jgi:hypothetical protein